MAVSVEEFANLLKQIGDEVREQEEHFAQREGAYLLWRLAETARSLPLSDLEKLRSEYLVEEYE